MSWVGAPWGGSGPLQRLSMEPEEHAGSKASRRGVKRCSSIPREAVRQSAARDSRGRGLGCPTPSPGTVRCTPPPSSICTATRARVSRRRTQEASFSRTEMCPPSTARGVRAPSSWTPRAGAASRSRGPMRRPSCTGSWPTMSSRWLRARATRICSCRPRARCRPGSISSARVRVSGARRPQARPRPCASRSTSTSSGRMSSSPTPRSRSRPSSSRAQGQPPSCARPCPSSTGPGAGPSC